MSNTRKPRQVHLGPLITAFVVGIVAFVLLNLSLAKQLSLIGALAAFAIAYVIPLMQTTYAARLDQRDAARYAREEAERKKAPNLRVTMQDGNSVELWPIGGHRRSNGRAVSLFVYVENIGDAPAQDVVVRIGLPPWGHQVILNPPTITARTEDGEIVNVTTNDESNEQILFGPGLLSYPLAQDVGTVTLKSPLHPGPSRCVGRVAFTLPDGQHRLPWAIESNYGLFKSDDDTALMVTLNKTAKGHDDVAFEDNPNENCRYCHALLRLDSWVGQVENALNVHRRETWPANAERIPKTTRGPISVQWYQKWEGPYRWVTCDVVPGETDSIIAAFWTAPDWGNREARRLSMDDFQPFAEEVWNFLKPPDDGVIP